VSKVTFSSPHRYETSGSGIPVNRNLQASVAIT
jgi:hypothetical protein